MAASCSRGREESPHSCGTPPIHRRRTTPRDGAGVSTTSHRHDPNSLILKHLGVDTYGEPVVYLSADCPVSRAEGWEALARIEVIKGAHRITATLNVVTGGLLGPNEISLSDVAWTALGAVE